MRRRLQNHPPAPACLRRPSPNILEHYPSDLSLLLLLLDYTVQHIPRKEEAIDTDPALRIPHIGISSRLPEHFVLAQSEVVIPQRARLRTDRTFYLYLPSHVSVAHKVSHRCIHLPSREHARVDIYLTAVSSSNTSRQDRHPPRCQRLCAPQSVNV